MPSCMLYTALSLYAVLHGSTKAHSLHPSSKTNQQVLLCVRGTFSASDLMTDLVCEPMPAEVLT